MVALATMCGRFMAKRKAAKRERIETGKDKRFDAEAQRASSRNQMTWVIR